MEIFSQVGGEFLSRWAHYLAGVTWIGLLYYFNFVQTPSFADFEAGPRTEAVRKLVPRALWWFRYGALLTLLSGLSILAFQERLGSDAGEFWKSPSGYSISTGILLALVMFANVWLVIWPAQRIVIANAEGTAAGRPADPNAAAAGRRGLLASRTNTLFSIPMLFFMAATSHFAPIYPGADGGARATYLIVVLLIVAVLELNALGKLGGYGPGGNTVYLDTHKNTIIAGFVLAAVLYILFEVVFG
ncbi:MAG TPA: urate hydroxylase PuuD [Mycobacteriales bacterium]|nr:urate hydroxylase PuuD [Mycobacteriales bacterium]